MPGLVLRALHWRAAPSVTVWISALVIATHDTTLAARADRVLLVDAGRVRPA